MASDCWLETGLFVNGVDTQGENLADNGGLRMAFKAYKNYLAKNGEQDDPFLPAKMSSYTSAQLFFMLVCIGESVNYK